MTVATEQAQQQLAVLFGRLTAELAVGVMSLDDVTNRLGEALRLAGAELEPAAVKRDFLDALTAHVRGDGFSNPFGRVSDYEARRYLDEAAASWKGIRSRTQTATWRAKYESLLDGLAVTS